MGKTSKSQIATLLRREPGFAAPIVTRPIKLPNGGVASEIGIDLSQAEVPERTYFGDVCGIEYVHETVRIIFGQLKRSGKPLSLVTISLSPQSILQFIETVDRMTEPSFAELLQIGSINSEPLLDFIDDPEDAANMKASLVAIALAGPDACLDFYDASPFVVAQARRSPSGKMMLRGVVRIDTRTAIMMSVMDRLKEIGANFHSGLIGVHHGQT